MRKRSEIPRCADRAFLRNVRHDPYFEEVHKKLGDLRSGTAEAEGEHVRPQNHHRPNFFFRKWDAYTARVATDEVELQLIELFGRDMNIAELAESGVDAVNDPAFF